MIMLGIRAKILLLIMAATLPPLLTLNIYWTNSERGVLKRETATRQALITQNDATSVNDFLNDKVRNLIIHSQSPSLLQQSSNSSRASLELGTLLYQDKDLTRVSLVDQNGQEQIALTNDLKASPLKNVQSSDAFKVVNYFAGNQYISPVTTGADGHPSITIAVPILNFTTPQDLGSLSTAESGVVRKPQDIKGALIAQVSLNGLWTSVLGSSGSTSQNGNGNGYAYIVDDKGAVIAHPEDALANSHKDLSSVPIVSLFKANLDTSATTRQLTGDSEKGVKVAATYQTVPSTKWAVIFQEPISSIYQNVNRVSQISLFLVIVVIIVMAVLSFGLSQYITIPILRIAGVAEQIGRGIIGERIAISRSDEIGRLGASINVMGDNLQTFITRIETQRHQLEVILNSTTDGILAMDAHGFITVANKAVGTLCGLTADTIVGKKITELLPWQQNAKPFHIDYLAPGTRAYDGVEYVSPSNVMHTIDVIVVRTASQTIVTLHDITKSRELEDMKVDFVSMAAHELRTPLSRIRGYLELATTQTNNTQEQVHAFIAKAHHSAIELSTLISNLLDVSRIERGNLMLTMDRIDIAAMLSHSVRNFLYAAETKSIALTYTGPDKGRDIIADHIAFREVIDNLIDNALKYTPQGGKVNVSLTQEGKSYVINVEDTGKGIPANALPYLFTKFYRVHGGLESGSGGTGLGLFITRSIIERHNGAIAVKSEEGRGSIFSVTIPVFDEAAFESIRTAKGVENVNKRRGWTTTNIAR